MQNAAGAHPLRSRFLPSECHGYYKMSPDRRSMKKKFENFWYYFKIPAVIALVLLALGLYFLLQPKTPVSDYDAAVISGSGCSEEQLERLQTILQQAGQDQNGDGAVTVKMHLYRFTIGAAGQDINEIAGLDADLVGKVSGIFLAEDPEAFEEASNRLVAAADAVPLSEINAFSGAVPDGLYLLLRSGADPRYSTLFTTLTSR